MTDNSDRMSRLAGARRDGASEGSRHQQRLIPKDAKNRLELAGFRIHPPDMAPLQLSTPSMSPAMASPHRGNCRRSKPRSLTCSGDSILSDLSALSTRTTPSRRAQPIAGDAFAMHPDLLSSPTPQDSHMAHTATAATFSPIAYWKQKRNASSPRYPVPPLTTSKPSPPSIIFIDCPPQ